MRRLLRMLGSLVTSLAIASAFGYGFYGLVTYVMPLSQGKFRQAMTSEVADETEVLINGATDAYEKGQLGESVKVLELTLEKLVDKGGHYKVTDRWKLEKVYFLLGKCYHRGKKFKKAIENYEETLRLNPEHLPAKYNLEMIKSKGGGGGGGSQQPKAGEIQPKI